MEQLSPSPFETTLSPQLLQEIRRVELRTRRAVDASLLGDFRSSFQGSGLVFSEIREYQPGDDVKHIHWKATARSGRVFVKSYEEERSLDVMLLVDRSNSMQSGGGRTGYSRAVELSALIAVLASRSRDGIGVCRFGDVVEAYRPPSRRRNQLPIMLQTLLDGSISPLTTDLAGALRYTMERLKRRSLVFVISDFFARDYATELRQISRRHDVVLSHIDLIRDELLPSEGLIEFRDAEGTRPIIIDCSSRSARASLAAIRTERNRRIEMLAQECGCDLMTVAGPPVRPLSDLMRMRRLRRR